MTEIQKLLIEMKDADNIKNFERDYGMCFLQECASIETDVLTFSLNHTTMCIHNTEDDYNEVCFDSFGHDFGGLKFDCTREEFDNHTFRLKEHIVFEDMPVLKDMYQRFKKYLDMNAVKKYKR